MLSDLAAVVFAVALTAPAQSLSPEGKPKPKSHPSLEEQAAIIDVVRNYALTYSQGLPDYVCTQVTKRYQAAAPGGHYAPLGVVPRWLLQDTLTIRLTYFEEKENYKLMLVNNAVAQQDYSKLGGATSGGDFGTMLRQIFEPATEAQFEWHRSEKLRSHLVYVFGYQVSQARSQWHIEYENQQGIIPAYRGLVHVDQETRQVLRVSLQSVDIPPSPVQDAEITLDYDYQMLGDQKFLLPLKSEVLMVTRTLLKKNDNEFRQYHKYSSESAIKYDTTPAHQPEDRTKEQPHK